MKFAKVMFLHLSVSHSVHRGGMCGRGVCVVGGGVHGWRACMAGGHVWWGHAWWEGRHGRGCAWQGA